MDEKRELCLFTIPLEQRLNFLKKLTAHSATGINTQKHPPIQSATHIG